MASKKIIPKGTVRTAAVAAALVFGVGWLVSRVPALAPLRPVVGR